MSVKIIVDSTVDVAERYLERFRTVPLTVRFGSEEYLDKLELGAREFYEKLIECDVMPTTSQANVSDFEEIYAKELSDGDEIVVITISSKLSGTYNSAVLASEGYEGRVFVVDSLSVSVGSGVLAQLAAELADAGISARDIARRLVVERDRLKVVAMFDTLEYLKRGGRISSGAAFAGNLLSLKPVLTVRDGEIAILGKARGSKQSNNYLIKEIENAGGIDFRMPLLLGYTGFDDTVLKKYISDSRHVWEGNTDSLDTTTVGSVVGTHAGPGAIAIAFFAR